MTTQALSSVAAFHGLFRCPILASPAIPDAKRCELRVSLIREELQELEDAIAANDIVEIADALADIQYVLSGAVHEFGMGSRFKALFNEVQRSNMSKACTTLEEAEATVKHYAENKGMPGSYEEVDGQWLVYRDGDRKVLKSVAYSAVDFTPILAASPALDTVPAAGPYEEPDCLAAVAAFHTLFRAPILEVPTIPDAKRCALRVSLIREETNELAEAIAANDIVEIADALADIQYVLSGAVLEFGMGSRFKALFDEVQRSNMSKACTSPEEAEATVLHYTTYQGGCASSFEEVDGPLWLVFRDGDRKVLKSVGYSAASLAPILEIDAENAVPAAN